MKCLVTGATGFLGCNLVHELVLDGWDVRASGMHGSDAQFIEGLPVEIIFADITVPDEVNAIVKGCDMVFHVADDTSFWSQTQQRQKQINVDGTINIAKACMKFGVMRMVHTSTADVLGYGPEGGLVNELNGHFNYHGYGITYGKTKYQAQKALQKLHQLGLDVVFMYPGFLIGPFDHTLQLGRALIDIKKGRMPFSPSGGSSFCHVTEVAKAHIQAAKLARPGDGYVCAGNARTNMTYHSLFTKMAFVLNAKPPRLVLGRRSLVLYGYLCELISKLTGKAPKINPGQARYLSEHQYSDSSKAIAELGYQVPIVEECIRDAVDWYQERGYEF